MKFLIDEKSIIIIPIKIAGEIRRLDLAIVFMENLLQIMLLITKKRVIKSMGDVLKYIIRNVSERFFIIDVVSIINNNIYPIPRMTFKDLPPKNSLISSISLPWKFF